jgi:hypothetical protein
MTNQASKHRGEELAIVVKKNAKTGEQSSTYTFT